MGRDEKAAVLRRHFICRPVAMNPARIIVDPVFYPFQFFGGQSGYIYTFGNKPPEYPVAVFIAPAFPTAVWMGIIDFLTVRCLPDRFAVQELAAVVRGDRLEYLGEIVFVPA